MGIARIDTNCPAATGWTGKLGDIFIIALRKESAAPGVPYACDFENCGLGTDSKANGKSPATGGTTIRR